MANRMGLVVVFKDGVTRAQATRALNGLKGLVEPNLTYPNGYGKAPVVTDDRVGREAYLRQWQENRTQLENIAARRNVVVQRDGFLIAIRC